MSVLLRATSVVAAAGLVVPLWAAPPASAATGTEPASTGAYYYSAGIDKPEDVAAEPPNVTGTATDGVEAEHLAVAVRVPNQVDKKSFLAFDLDAVPFDATITKAVLTVPLAPAGPGNQQISPAAAKVQACGAGPEGFNSEDGKSFAGAPTDTCDALKVVGKDSADKKAYVFEITPIASTWLSEANNGVALLPAETSSPFQVVFLPFAQATLAVEYTAPPVEPEVLDVPLEEPVVTTDVGGLAGDPGSADTGGSAGATDGDLGLAAAPVVAGGEGLETPAAGPEAEVAPEPVPAGQPVAVARVASVLPSEVLSPTTGALLAGVLFAGLLALLSLIMGDPRVAAPGTAAPSRLSQALQRRQAAAGAGRTRLLGA